MTESSRRVCVVFPYGPDPAATLAAVRSQYPERALVLYTANREAAHRASQAADIEVVCPKRSMLHVFPPAELQRERFEATVCYFSAEHFNIYFPLLVQSWGIKAAHKQYICDGKRLNRFQYWWFFWRRAIVALGSLALKVAILNVYWFAQLWFYCLLGLTRGRSLADCRQLVRSSMALLGSPRTLLSLNMYSLGRNFLVAQQVLRDFARRRASEPQNPATRRLLLIRLDHIGDIVLTTGVLDAWRSKYPDWKLTMVVAPWGESVVRNHPAIDELLVFPTRDATTSHRKLSRDQWRRRREIYRYLSSTFFDVIIDPSVTLDSPLLFYTPNHRQRVAMETGRWFIHMFAQVLDYREGEAEQARLTRMFQAAGFDIAPTYPRLYIDDSHLRAADHVLRERGLLGQRFLAIHMGGTWPGRCWATSKYVEIAKRAFEDYSLRPVAFFLASEADKCREYEALTREIGGVGIIGMPLDTVLAIIAKSAAFIGNDSGLMHAAAALERPTLGVFGPGEIGRFAPCGKMTAVSTLRLKCSPCPQTYCTDQRCLRELEVPQVWNDFATLLCSAGEKSTEHAQV